MRLHDVNLYILCKLKRIVTIDRFSLNEDTKIDKSINLDAPVDKNQMYEVTLFVMESPVVKVLRTEQYVTPSVSA